MISMMYLIQAHKEKELPYRVRDPFDAFDSKLICMPPRKLTTTQRTHNVEKMREALARVSQGHMK